MRRKLKRNAPEPVDPDDYSLHVCVPTYTCSKHGKDVSQTISFTTPEVTVTACAWCLFELLSGLDEVATLYETEDE